VLAVIDLVDSAGFHGMAEEIEAAESVEDVNPRSLGTVENVLTAARAVAWSDELTESVDTFTGSLETLAAALGGTVGGTDLEGMKEAAGPVHETQHGLSHDVYQWLATTDPTEVGIGSDDPATGGDQTDSTIDQIYRDAEVIEIEVTDWEWDPVEIELELGVPVILEITNTGALPHGIWIPGLGINEETPPGETVRVPFTPETPGEHFVGCANDLCGTAEQHASMTATFIVNG
jgi:heme/copper-type cytochrome/quinol oxidase subunit 2